MNIHLDFKLKINILFFLKQLISIYNQYKQEKLDSQLSTNLCQKKTT